MTFDTSPAISADMIFDEVVQRLAQNSIVHALIAVGTSRAGLLTPASDYDLVVVLSAVPDDLILCVTQIDHRLAEILFESTASVQELAELREPLDITEPLVPLARWLNSGEILFDRTGIAGKAQQLLRDSQFVRDVDGADMHGAWFSLNYNLAQTRRYLSSDDPAYLLAGEMRISLYGLPDIVYSYFLFRKLPWQGDKAAIRYWQMQDPTFLDSLVKFIREQDGIEKLHQYEQLAAMTVAPIGEIWPLDATAVTFKGAKVNKDMNGRALAFWRTLIGA